MYSTFFIYLNKIFLSRWLLQLKIDSLPTYHSVMQFDRHDNMLLTVSSTPTILLLRVQNIDVKSSVFFTLLKIVAPLCQTTVNLPKCWGHLPQLVRDPRRGGGRELCLHHGPGPQHHPTHFYGDLWTALTAQGAGHWGLRPQLLDFTFILNHSHFQKCDKQNKFKPYFAVNFF